MSIHEIDACAEHCIPALSAVSALVESLGVAHPLSLPSCRDASHMLEGFANVGFSTITVTASVLNPPVCVCDVTPSAVSVFYTQVFGGSLLHVIPSVVALGVQASSCTGFDVVWFIFGSSWRLEIRFLPKPLQCLLAEIFRGSLVPALT